MAENRNYYYLKLKENFFDSDSMIALEAEKNGYKYSNILLKLYLLSLKYNGRLMVNECIPYNSKLIAKVTRHDEKTVKNSLEILQKYNLIEILDTGAIYMSDIQNFIGESSTEADRKREYRNRINSEKQGVLQQDKEMKQDSNCKEKNNGKPMDKCPTNGQTNLHQSIENKDKSIENKDKSLDIRDKTKYISNTAGETEQREEYTVSLPLKDGSLYLISKEQRKELEKQFQGVNIEYELQKMILWLNSNPRKRKTEGGIYKFILNWLFNASEKKNKHGGNVNNTEYDFEQIEKNILAN